MATGKAVDELIVEIRAETAGLRKGLNQVNKQLGKTNATARSSVLTFGNLTRIFAAVGFSRLIKGVIDTTRTFEDLRATLNANTDSVKETDDAFDMILKFTATTTFQIEQVTKAFIEFRRIGIKPTEDQLRGIGNVAAAQGQSIDQVANAIFKGGTTSIEQLQAMGFTAKTVGDQMTISFGEEGAVGSITETIDKSVQSVLGFVAKVGDLKFMDAIENRAKTLTGAISNLGDMTSIFQNQIGESGLKDAVNELVMTFIELTKQGSEEGGLADTLGSILGSAVRTLNSLLITLNENANKVKFAFIGLAAVLTVNFTAAAIGSIATAFTAMGVAAATAAKSVKLLMTRVLGLTALALANPITAAVLGVSALVVGGTAFAMKDELKAGIAKLMAEISALFDVPTTDPDGDGSDGSTNTKIVTTTAATAKLTEGMEQLQESVVQSSLAFTKNFVDSLMDGKNALAGFKDFAKNMVSQIISIFLQMEVVNRILASVFPALGIQYGGIITPSGGGAVTPPPPPASAGGGSAYGGRAMVVGERGPEIFVPHSAGTVMNNMNSKNAMGSGGTTIINQSINFATGVVPTVRAEVIKMMPQIADVTKGAVVEAAMRGGNFRRALQGG
tara:strand:- start:418 stop:2268 length:1851 start_codon:yes stop_codon:yes gene_type:complete